MTWGEIKKQIEDEGVKDGDDVRSIDIQGAQTDLNAVPTGAGWIIEGVQ